MILSEEAPSGIRLVTMGIATIWYNRNQITHGKNALSVQACSLKIASNISQFDLRSLLSFNHSANINHEDTSSMNFFSDGSYCCKNVFGGWATVVLFDNLIIRCKAGITTASRTVMEVEVRGFLESIKMAEVMGCPRANFFSDSTDTIWAFQTGICRNNNCLPLIREGISLLHDHPGWKIHHVFREENTISDYLAHKARINLWTWDSDVSVPLLPVDVSLQLSKLVSPFSIF